MTENFDRLIARAEQLISRIEFCAAPALGAPDWQAAIAWRYRKRSSGHGVLEPVRHVAAMQRPTCARSMRRKRRSSATPSSSWPARRPTTCC